MKNELNLNDLIFEHRFWLQILGDHARFILNELSPVESEEIEGAKYFIGLFDELLEDSRKRLSEKEILALTQRAYEAAGKIRAFKLNLLRQHLTGEIAIGLTPTFINHMVNEVEEYLRILKFALSGKCAPISPVHYHILWLLDGEGHAASIQCSLDETEKELIKKSMEFKKDFAGLYRKAEEMAGYLRTNLGSFPAIDKLNMDANLKMRMFMTFLEEIKELRLSKEVLGSIMPLVPDHMLREECYYLTKLSNVSEVPSPECDPGKPRLEE